MGKHGAVIQRGCSSERSNKTTFLLLSMAVLSPGKLLRLAAELSFVPEPGFTPSVCVCVCVQEGALPPPRAPLLCQSDFYVLQHVLNSEEQCSGGEDASL